MTDQKYRVVKRLEAGGMAEVFVGEALSMQGFKKKVAIKRVLPHLAQNKNFIGMFLDEARLGARLNHANVVTVFDIGAADNTYFIVMEYVDGCNLKKVIESLRDDGKTVPLKDAIFIAMEACRGLSFAHELVDDDGEALDIVHRDVSPPNILISKRGEVKVTDFGLAKATTQLEKTDPGVVKGKFSYLSPEAARGENVDERADIFAMGVVLWEMVSGRRLFLGETDYQTIKKVQEAQVPPLSSISAEVDEEFDGVLARAMTSDPAARYETAREFGDALAGYLFSKRMKVTGYDIANLVKSALDSAEARSSDTSGSHQNFIDKLIQEEMLRFTSLDEEDAAPAPGASPLSDAADGAAPLDAMSFENPADWFDDDDGISGNLAEQLGGDDAGGWREAGIEGASDLAALEDPSSAEVRLTPELAAELEASDEMKLPETSDAAPASAEAGGAGKLVGLAALGVLAACAAYYFLVIGG